jgi:hypothetical protein
MKKIILIILMLYSQFLLTVSPYIGISVGNNINQSTYLIVTKKVLQTEGFQKITQYKGNAKV